MNTTYDNPSAEAEPKRDRRPVWIRGAFMLFFLAAFSIAQTLMAVTAVIQFLSMMIAGEPNRFLAEFGTSLGRWLEQVSRFQAGASEEKPFPWAPWPKG